MSRLSVIIPVYNEAPQLEKVFRFLFKAQCPIEREWIVIDDCSTDGSTKILETLSSELGFKLLKQETNQGKGAAITRGIAEAQGDFVVIQDADFEYDPGDIPSLLEPLLNDEADVVYGSRFKDTKRVHRTYHYFVNRFLSMLSNLLSGIYLTDMETCYKVFKRDLLQAMQLRSKRFGIEVELTAYISKLRLRIYELPIGYYPRTHLQGKKINWRDGIAALFHLIRFNLLTSRKDAFQNLPERYTTESREMAKA